MSTLIPKKGERIWFTRITKQWIHKHKMILFIITSICMCAIIALYIYPWYSEYRFKELCSRLKERGVFVKYEWSMSPFQTKYSKYIPEWFQRFFKNRLLDVHISGAQVDAASLHELANQLHIKKLRVENAPSFDDDVFNKYCNSNELSVVVLYRTSVTAAALRSLHSLPNIKHIVLYGVHLSYDDLAFIDTLPLKPIAGAIPIGDMPPNFIKLLALRLEEYRGKEHAINSKSFIIQGTIRSDESLDNVKNLEVWFENYSARQKGVKVQTDQGEIVHEPDVQYINADLKKTAMGYYEFCSVPFGYDYDIDNVVVKLQLEFRLTKHTYKFSFQPRTAKRIITSNDKK